VFFHIVLPHARRIIAPTTTSLGIDLIKDTALASTIATPELMLRALDLITQSFPRCTSTSCAPCSVFS
jgi:polar amino acid transport system permease protein